mmetsp:Transcript_56920/g.180107  ORF Transcript_56920/g.180107 Transcript_56920/m.180107 type:complete len:552 (-) Transcript_56920:13-1668(-)
MTSRGTVVSLWNRLGFRVQDILSLAHRGVEAADDRLQNLGRVGGHHEAQEDERLDPQGRRGVLVGERPHHPGAERGDVVLEPVGQHLNQLLQEREGGHLGLEGAPLELRVDGLDQRGQRGAEEGEAARRGRLVDARGGARLLEQVDEHVVHVDLHALLALAEAGDELRARARVEGGQHLRAVGDERREALGGRAAHLPRHVLVVAVLILRAVVVLFVIVAVFVHVLVPALAVVLVVVVGVVLEVLQGQGEHLREEGRELLGAALHEALQGLQGDLAQLVVRVPRGAAVLLHHGHHGGEIRAHAGAHRAAYGAHCLDIGALALGLLGAVGKQRHHLLAGGRQEWVAHGDRERREAVGGALADPWPRHAQQRQQAHLDLVVVPHHERPKAGGHVVQDVQALRLHLHAAAVILREEVDKLRGEALDDTTRHRSAGDLRHDSLETDAPDITLLLLLAREELSGQTLDDVVDAGLRDLAHQRSKALDSEARYVSRGVLELLEHNLADLSLYLGISLKRVLLELIEEIGRGHVPEVLVLRSDLLKDEANGNGRHDCG